MGDRVEVGREVRPRAVGVELVVVEHALAGLLDGLVVEGQGLSDLPGGACPDGRGGGRGSRAGCRRARSREAGPSRSCQRPRRGSKSSAYSASCTSRPVTWSSAAALPRLRLSTRTASAEPASPLVPDTASRKSSTAPCGRPADTKGGDAARDPALDRRPMGRGGTSTRLSVRVPRSSKGRGLMASISKRDVGGKPRYDVNYREPDGRQRRKTFRRRSDAERFTSTVEADKAARPLPRPRRGPDHVQEVRRRVAREPDVRGDDEGAGRGAAPGARLPGARVEDARADQAEHDPGVAGGSLGCGEHAPGDPGDRLDHPPGRGRRRADR